MAMDSTLDYFENDQVRFAVMLWRLVRKAGGADFDVLKFGRDWAYADAVILQCLASENNAVADAALDLMQLRLRFETAYPERAHKLGAVAVSGSVPGAAPTTNRNDPEKNSHASDTKYINSLR